MTEDESGHKLFRDWKIALAGAAIWLLIWVPIVLYTYLN